MLIFGAPLHGAYRFEKALLYEGWVMFRRYSSDAAHAGIMQTDDPFHLRGVLTPCQIIVAKDPDYDNRISESIVRSDP